MASHALELLFFWCLRISVMGIQKRNVIALLLNLDQGKHVNQHRIRDFRQGIQIGDRHNPKHHPHLFKLPHLFSQVCEFQSIVCCCCLRA